MKSKLREIVQWKDPALSVINLDKIRSINDFYEAYRKILAISKKIVLEEKRSAELEKRTVDLNKIDELLREDVIRICSPLINKHRLIFDCGPENIYATLKGFDQFSASRFCLYPKLPLDDFNAFSAFLEELQYAATKELYYRDSGTVLNRSFANFIDFIDRFIDNFTGTYKLDIELTNEKLFLFRKAGAVRCSKENHTIVPRVYYAKGTEEQGIVPLPAHYCMDCGKYYIGRTTYKMYVEDYGEMIVEKYAYEDFDKVYSKFNPETRLHAFGYDASVKGPSEEKRQELLLFLLESGRMTYFEICTTIENDIQLFEDRYEMGPAVEKWRKDLKYINDLVVNGKIIKW